MAMIWDQPPLLASRPHIPLLLVSSDATDANVTNPAGEVDFTALDSEHSRSNEARKVELSEIRQQYLL